MMLDLPPEIIVLALSDCNIHQVHNFQLVCRATNEIIQSHSASVYRALAIHYGLAHKDEDWEGIVKSRRVYFDWLKEPRGHDGDENQEERRMLVGGWKEYVKRHFMLERNWREGRCVPSLHFKAARPHRIQIDEVEGTVLSTHVTGNVTSTCIQSGSPLWTETRAPPWAHCEFDNGFLIWGRGDHTIEVWRRKSDQLSDPLPAASPDMSQLPEQQYTRPRSSDSDRGDEGTADSLPLHHNRGHFYLFALLSPPKATSASRFIYPHLLLATHFLEHAYIYDIPSNRLLKTIELGGPDEQIHQIYYVEHNLKHIFICTRYVVYVYGKEDGRLFLKLPLNIVPHLRLRVAWDGVTLFDPMPRAVMQKMDLVPVEREETQYSPVASMGEFSAVHVSECGGIWVIMNEAGYILVITGGQEDPTQITVVSVLLGDGELTYLAFDGHHIAVAGSKGIYVISLNRFRDPTLNAEAALTSLIKGHVLLIPQPGVDMGTTSCLQVTETAIWHVARKSLRTFEGRISRIDFAAELDM